MRDICFDERQLACTMYDDVDKANEWDALQNRGSADRDLEPLELRPDDVLLDLGCGCGYHAITAAQVCRVVHGVDISSRMISCAKRNVRRTGLQNIEMHTGGVLSINFSKLDVTKVFSWGTFHHLPDVWKGEAFLKVAHALPDGGRFHLMDLAFSFNLSDRHKYQKLYIDEVRELHGPEVADDLATAFESEFVTYHWILDALLRQAGFHIERTFSLPNRCWSNFVCVKKSWSEIRKTNWT